MVLYSVDVMLVIRLNTQASRRLVQLVKHATHVARFTSEKQASSNQYQGN